MMEYLRRVKLGERMVGDGFPVYIVAEIGINHNGELGVAKKLIDIAKAAGCDAVKFQKRTPDICVPEDQKNRMRETPWGYISYLEYRHKLEFGKKEYDEIDRYCRERNMIWFASCWDESSVDFMEQYDPPCFKLPSAQLVNKALLKKIWKTKHPLILSTGMSTMEEVKRAVQLVGEERTILCHCVASYPAADNELNLGVITTLQQSFGCVTGYSGHEVGLATTYAAVALGAKLVERHITLDRAMWGTDQAASVEAGGLLRLVRDIRAIESAMGDGIKRVLDSELPMKKKLRGC